MGQEAPKPNTNIGKQIDIDFAKAAKDALEKECEEVAQKYKVIDKTQIFKDPEGVWRYYGTYLSVKDVGEEMNNLYEGNDNAELFKKL